MKELEKIKAVFVDIDGTLANSKREITEFSKAPIKRMKDKGIYVVLCSGRSNKDVCEYSKEAFASDYAISSNGAQIYNYKTNENFYKDDIKYEELKMIWDYCNENGLELILNAKDVQYGNKIFCSDMYKDKIIIKSIEELKEKDIFQVIINSNTYYSMKECADFISENERLKIANYSREYMSKKLDSKEPYYIFVNSKSTDKGTAISKFLETMNIDKEEAICFGDRINDITMFKSCGKTVAMKNADEDLKKMANFITPLSNDENGVADFLNKFI